MADMKNGGFFLNHRFIKWEAVGDTRVVTAFEKSTLDFIQAWRSKQTIFELKTSGSTGQPKTIRVARHQLVASAHQTIDFLKLTENDTALCCLPTSYIAGKMMLVRAMEADMLLLANEPGSHPLENVAQSPTFTAVVPLQLLSMVDNLRQGTSLKNILVGGAQVSTSLKNSIEALQVPVFETYGMTETLSHVALKKISGEKTDSYFRILPNIQFRQNTDHCLELRGEVTNNQWIKTTDVVRLYDDGFEWLGRLDNVINTGGIKIYPETVEEMIRKIMNRDGINHRIILTALDDSRLGSRLILLVEGKIEDGLQELKKHLQGELPKYQCPKGIYSMPSFNETETGKVHRNNTITKFIRSYLPLT